MDKWRHPSSFLAGLLLVVGALAWIVVPSAAFAKGPPAQNPGPAFGEMLAAIAKLQTAVENLATDGVAADLGAITQNWDKTLDPTNGDADGCNSDRFTCIFDGAAVRDNETGLVWERPPDTALHPWVGEDDARRQCSIDTTTGGRKGWRLPSVHELASLVDPSKTNPALPTDHPFTTIANVDYWPVTTSADDPDDGWTVSFLNGDLTSGRNKAVPQRVLCVRGGHNDGRLY